MDKKNLAFGKVNFILLAVGMAIVIIGFLLMSGSGSDEHTFDTDIFSTRRIVVAPVVLCLGFFLLFMLSFVSQKTISNIYIPIHTHYSIIKNSIYQ